MARSHYYLSIADLAKARGSDPQFSFSGAGPNDFAAALQQALRDADLFNRWRAAQPDPDAVDDQLAQTDPQAEVNARVSDLHIEVDLLTTLPMSIVRQRLNLLIGSAWQLRDMRSALSVHCAGWRPRCPSPAGQPLTFGPWKKRAKMGRVNGCLRSTRPSNALSCTTPGETRCSVFA